MSHFHLIDRDINFLLPPAVQEWLPERHLARYVVEVVEGLDLGDLERPNTVFISEDFARKYFRNGRISVYQEIFWLPARVSCPRSCAAISSTR